MQLRQPLRGSNVKVMLRRGGVTLAERILSRYGETELTFRISSSTKPTEVEVFVDADLTFGVPLTNPKSNRLMAVHCEIVDARLEPIDFGLRGQLTSFAIDTAEKLGLRGVYVSEDRAREAANTLSDLLREERPFSVIRLGDGEGRILGYPDYFSDSEIATQVLYYHFGPQAMTDVRAMHGDRWVQHATSDLRQMLYNAMVNADNIGLPVYDFFRNMDDGVTSGMIGYGCATYTALPLFPEKPVLGYIGTNYFQQLGQGPHFYPAICTAAKKTFLVGPWDLREGLGDALGVNDLQYIEVPRHFTWSEGAGVGQYPHLYKIVENKIRRLGNLGGQLFLVGAGILAKHYCEVIRQHGGVALDIGSVFDSWAKEGLPYAVRNNARVNFEVLKKKS